eukprot:g1947.t1
MGWTLISLLVVYIFNLSHAQQATQQWEQVGHENVNLREAAMVDMGNNFTLLFGGSSLLAGEPVNLTYTLAYNQFTDIKTEYSWRLLKYFDIDHIPLSRRQHVLLNVKHGEVLLFGGECYEPRKYVSCSTSNNGKGDGNLHWRFISNIVNHEEKGVWKRDVKYQGNQVPSTDLRHMATGKLNVDGSTFVVYGGQTITYANYGQAIKGKCSSDTWIGKYVVSNNGKTAIVNWEKIDSGNPGTFYSPTMSYLMDGSVLMFGGERGVNKENLPASALVDRCEPAVTQSSSYVVLESWIFTYENNGVSKSKWEKQLNLISQKNYENRYKMVNAFGKVFAFHSFGKNDGIVARSCELYYFDRGDKVNQWKVAASNIDKMERVDGGYLEINPCQGREKFTFATLESKYLVVSGGYDGINILGDTWFINQDLNNPQYLYKFLDVTGDLGPAIPRRSLSTAFQYKNHLFFFGGMISKYVAGQSSIKKEYTNDLWILYNMESYVKGYPIGRPNIPSPRGYMDLRMMQYQGCEIGITFGGFNGNKLDDTWFFIPSMGGTNDMLWVKYIEQRNNIPYPTERNSYAMASWNNGIIMSGGIMDDRDAFETWYFHCQDGNDKHNGIILDQEILIQELQSNCRWYKMIQPNSNTPVGEIPYIRLASLSQHDILVLSWRDPKNKCTWIFRKLSEDVVVSINQSGEWMCIGSNDNMPSLNQPVFVGLSYMTAVSYGENYMSTIYTFVYNNAIPNASAWVGDTGDNVPIIRRKKSTFCLAINTKVKKNMLAIMGGEIESRELLSDTWFYVQGCPAGYEINDINPSSRYCSLCKKGFFKSGSRDDSKKCNKCSPLRTTKYTGSKYFQDCNIPSEDACSYKEDVKFFNSETGKVVCECDSFSVGDRCEFLGFLGKPYYVWLIGAISILFFAALIYMGRKYFRKKKFYKFRINEEIKNNQLYTRMLDETKEEIKFRESELRHIQEGWKIREEDIQLVKKIGLGSYASVYRGKWDALDNTPVAIKVLNVTPTSSKTSIFNDTETQVLQRIRHPRLVLFFGCGRFSLKGSDFIVTEYVDGGDLRSVLLREKKEMKTKSPLLSVDTTSYPSSKRLQYAIDIAEGMAFLHSKRFIHRDLKSANILCTKNGRCKITDFGLSRLLAEPITSKSINPEKNMTYHLSSFGNTDLKYDSNESNSSTSSIVMTGYVGSVVWMAPEVMKSRNVVYNQAVDVFSYAMVVFEIITAEIPWERAKDADEVFDNVEIGGRPAFTPHPEVPEVLIQIMKSAWKQDPEERPSFSEIFETLKSSISQANNDKKKH